MAIDLRQLEERLHHFAELLGAEPKEHESAAGPSDATTPHIELIDFDDLRRMLTETIAVLTTVAKQNDDAAVVRNWLGARIVALRRARQAFLREGLTPIDPVEENMPLPTLLRCFEDETARWRAATADKSRRPGRSGGRGHKEYLEFKS